MAHTLWAATRRDALFRKNVFEFFLAVKMWRLMTHDIGGKKRFRTHRTRYLRCFIYFDAIREFL